MKVHNTLLAVTVSVLTLTVAAGSAHAAVSADEAAKLGSTLTAFGAEKAGSSDGLIPAYDGGARMPADYKGGNIRPSPYASEKPRLVIKGKDDAAKYAAQLTAGAAELLKRYAGFRMDVYPTHRSVSYPQYILHNTAKNAIETKTSNGGLSISGYRAGVPFPIPKNGYEVMWNHNTRFTGVSFELKYDAVNVDRSGRATLATTGVITQEYPIYSPKNADRLVKGADVYFQTKVAYSAPARRAGEALMIKDYLDPLEHHRRGWLYLPGQRRVKEAPEIAYDTPNPGTAGNTTYDDAFIFNGAMDRFDMKLVGKKEILVPYNTYAWSYDMGRENLTTPNFLNPDAVRWELHRVWVVEATLKPGKRHIYSKRVFYVDEDSWTALASDMYDARGQLFRAGFFSLSPAYDKQAANSVGQLFYDFSNGSYNVSGINAGKYGGIKFTDALPANDWAPDALAGAGIR